MKRQRLFRLMEIKFIFLGKPETDLILRKLKVLDSKCDHKVSIVFYSTFLNWDIYNDIISKSDLLLCPIKNKTSFYWVDEFYGKTKVSGSETDCIFNGKIGIFPSSYTKMNWHNLYYNNALTLEHILNTMSIEKLEIEYVNLQHYLLQYDFKKVKSQLENQLLNLV